VSAWENWLWRPLGLDRHELERSDSWSFLDLLDEPVFRPHVDSHGTITHQTLLLVLKFFVQSVFEDISDLAPQRIEIR
jgi:hypothetical protein